MAGTAESILGADGVTQGMVIWMNWVDVIGGNQLPTPLGQLLGYSQRTPVQFSLGGSNIWGLHRQPPWQSPYFNQLYVKRISSVRGVQAGGKIVVNPAGWLFGGQSAPSINFKLALVALEFWRPPYFVLRDDQVSRDPITGYPQEWFRYLDKRWEMSTQMLMRQGQQFGWLDASDAGGFQGGIPGSPGQPLTKLHLKRRWYEIPEQAIFTTTTDVTPQGIPARLMYNSTAVVNPVTCFSVPGPPDGVMNYPNGGVPPGIASNTLYTLPVHSPITGTVNASTYAAGGATPNEIYDSDGTYNPGSGIIPYNRFLGFPMGTLLYLGAELIARPLQLPAWMMGIPYLNQSEPYAQQQYDVVFNFLYFDPPTNQGRTSGTKEPFQGHNLMPFSGTGNWKMARCQIDTTGTANSKTGPIRTALDYANFKDLFVVIQDGDS